MEQNVQLDQKSNQFLEILAFLLCLDLVMSDQINFCQTDNATFFSNSVKQLVDHLQPVMHNIFEGKIDAHSKPHRIDLLHQLTHEPPLSFPSHHHYFSLQGIIQTSVTEEFDPIMLPVVLIHRCYDVRKRTLIIIAKRDGARMHSCDRTLQKSAIKLDAPTLAKGKRAVLDSLDEIVQLMSKWIPSNGLDGDRLKSSAIDDAAIAKMHLSSRLVNPYNVLFQAEITTIVIQ